MGDCSDHMKTKIEKKDTKTSIFGAITPRKRKVDEAEAKTDAEIYGMLLTQANPILDRLIAVKTNELAMEKGRELENALKLANLKAQRMHLDATIDYIHDWEQIKK